LLAIVLLALASTAHAAGFRFVEVPADAQGPTIKAALWYPCAEPAGKLELGPFILPVVKDCPLPSDKHPLVVISHGRGGTFLGHHDTAEAFADSGFIVVALNHPGDTYSDMSRSSDLSVFVSRPADIKRVVDFMLAASPAMPVVDPTRIGFFGFSRGGYTGLIALGANSDWATATEFCRDSPFRMCKQIVNKEFPTEPLTHDLRIKAAIIVDPLAVTFTAAGLAPIKAPVQLWASELGGDGVFLRDVAAVDSNLASPHEFHVVRNAGHFAFFQPCSAALEQAESEICDDRAGFDRVAFHKELNATAVAFLQKHLSAAVKQ
jgi:predicted dienelactone hydrolase